MNTWILLTLALVGVAVLFDNSRRRKAEAQRQKQETMAQANETPPAQSVRSAPRPKAAPPPEKPVRKDEGAAPVRQPIDDQADALPDPFSSDD